MGRTSVRPFPIIREKGRYNMLELTIGNKNCLIEYTMEAALYKECGEKITMLMARLGDTSEMPVEEIIGGMSDLPNTCLICFYAGLLEHHGEYGDGTVTSIKDAKILIKQYFEDHADDDAGNFFDLLLVLVKQMEADGFFRQIGLEQMFADQPKPKKVPQDRKKKATKTAEVSAK